VDATLAGLQDVRLLPTIAYYAALLIPWRGHVRVRAAKSGLEFSSHRRCVIARHIAKYGAIEPELTGWLTNYLSSCPAGLFIDAGANIGWYSLHAARLPGVERVVAFEADPSNAWLLDLNRRNDLAKIVLMVAALGDRRGTAQLHRYKASNSGRHSIAVDHGGDSITVPLTDLDSALDDLGFGDKPIAALKIDVEGFEPAVIAGAKRALARTQAVVLELSPVLNHNAGLSTETMLQTLRAAGFAPFTLRGDGTLQPDTTDWIGKDCVVDVIWLKDTAKTGASGTP
jgi:FkbM family methyltransferase